jgi:predicted GNAT family acetyltransferase
MTSSSPVVDNPSKHRFELPIGEETAFANYRIQDGRYILIHTEVPQHLSGRGFGSQLARGVFDAIRNSGMRAVARCPFMAQFARRHPEYSSLLDS